MQSVTCHPLRGDLAVIHCDVVEHVQWQYELPGGARVSDTLGHRSVTVTTEIYRHPIAPVRSGQVAAMDAITSKAKRRPAPRG